MPLIPVTLDNRGPGMYARVSGGEPMKRILIAYHTVSGSTGEMAGILGAELGREHAVDMLPATADAPAVAGYDMVILGSPMRFGGFASPVKRFIRKNRDLLEKIPVAAYLSVLYIVKRADEPVPETETYVDPSLEMRSLTKKEATFFDTTHSAWYYHTMLSKSFSGLKPVAVGYLNGRMFPDRLGLLPRLFMKVILRFTTKEREGEFLNPAAVREWAALLGNAIRRLP